MREFEARVATTHRVVIVGGGFGGMHAALALRKAPVHITLIDRRNFHLFQPLLYQVATGALSPADVASPLRVVFKNQKNVEVLLGEVVGIDHDNRQVHLRDGDCIPYDTLILATGSTHHYFGHDEWALVAPGLKTIEDALDIRTRIFIAFEAAEREPDLAKRLEWLTFIVVGGGPTGVELAGALGEIANETLRKDFRHINTREARIYLVEADDRVLGTYPPDLSQKADEFLRQLGVTIVPKTRVTQIDDRGVIMKAGERSSRVDARTVLWAAGVRGSSLGKLVAAGNDAILDRAGRVLVEPDLSMPGHPHVFVIGDLAAYLHQDGQPLPGIAPTAIQQGEFVAKLVVARLRGQPKPTFRYHHQGSLATVGRAAAVADFGKIRISGLIAWLAWVFIHLMKIVEFENRLLVFVQWLWYYVTKNRGARLITGEHRLPTRD